MKSEPDIRLDGLSIWVRGRQFTDASDYWDGNWLMVKVTMKDAGASVTVEGPLLRTDEISRFRDELTGLYDTLRGEAVLNGLEPNLSIHLKMMSLGHIAGEIEITPDHQEQYHRFVIGLDQSDLPALVTSLDTILKAYPIVGSPGD